MRARAVAFWIRCKPALVVLTLSLILAACGVFIGLTLINRTDDNAKEVKSAQREVGKAKTKAATAQKKTDDAQDTASAADRRSKRVVQYLQGKRGLPGVPGKNGKIGARGPAGVEGPAGPPGKDGKDGRDATVTREDLFLVLAQYCATRNCRGPQGPQGPTGATGPAGPAGPIGPPGPAMQRDFSVSFPRQDGTTGTLACSDPEGDSTYVCQPVAAP
jgi:hypothetical protein